MYALPTSGQPSPPSYPLQNPLCAPQRWEVPWILPNACSRPESGQYDQVLSSLQATVSPLSWKTQPSLYVRRSTPSKPITQNLSKFFRCVISVHHQPPLLLS